MSVLDSSFSSVGGRALSSNLVITTDIFHQFFCQISAHSATSVKIAENDMKFHNIKTKIFKDICSQEY